MGVSPIEQAGASTATKADDARRRAEREATFHVLGLDCRGCARHAERALSGVDGVRAASVRFLGELAQVVYDAGRTSEREIRLAMARGGFRLRRVESVAPSGRVELGRVRLGVSVVLFAQLLALAPVELANSAATGLAAIRMVFAAIVLALGGYPMLRRAARRAREGMVGGDALLSVAALGSFVLGLVSMRGAESAFTAFHGFETAAGIVVLAQLARAAYVRLWERALAELAEAERARLTLASRVTASGAIEQVSREALVVGDTVLIASGEHVPADVRIDVVAHVQTMSAGRGRTTTRGPGEVLSSGQILRSASLTGRVVRPYRAAMASAQDAQVHRVLLRIDRERGTWSSREGWSDIAAQALFAGVFTLAIFSVVAHAMLAGGFARPAPWFAAIAVLVVSSPSAFVLAAPLARAVAIVRARSLGIVVKDPRALEALARATIACFEKTGTITHSDRRVVGLTWQASTPDPSVLGAVLALESLASHPSGRAVATYLRARGVVRATEPPTSVHEQPGLITGRVGEALIEVGASERLAIARGPEPASAASLAWFSKNGQPLGYFVLEDSPRPHVDKALRALGQRNLPCRILSGDTHAATQATAHGLSVAGAGGLTDADKTLVVRDLQHAGSSVLYVWDGSIHGQAPAHAEVSIALASGALPGAVAAPLLMVEPRLDRLPWLLDLARSLRTHLRAMTVVTVVFNATLVPLAAMGRLPALHAAALALAETLLGLGLAAHLLWWPRSPRDDS
jgi:cation transport ATPase